MLGATGGTGQRVVSQALQRGWQVTALVRDPARLKISSDRLRVVVGDVTGESGPLLDAMKGQSAVVSALGVGKSFTSGGMIARAVPAIVRAMNAHDVGRLVFMSAFGVGESVRDVPAIPRLFIRTLLRDVYHDKAAGESMLRASDLDWTIVYPTGLTDRAATGAYRVGERLALRRFPTIARADVAGFLLDQVDDRRYLHKGVLIAN